MNKDVSKFATAMQGVVTAVVQMLEAGLLTEETGLKLIADVAQRFGQDFDAKTELGLAREEREKRKKERQTEDSFNLPSDLRDALRGGTATTDPAVEK